MRGGTFITWRVDEALSMLHNLRLRISGTEDSVLVCLDQQLSTPSTFLELNDDTIQEKRVS